MTNRRKFIRQMAAAGIAGSVPSMLFSQQKPVFCDAESFMPGNSGEQLYIGWSSADITPEKPVALTGQLHKRISESVQDPLTATVLALETRDGLGNAEQAIMVSCDLIFMRAQTQEKLQHAVAGQLPGFDGSKLFLNATHTHTGPGLIDKEFFDLYDTGDNSEVMKPSEYEAFFIDRVASAIVHAWRNRSPGGFS
jgi:hypothetical protein